MRKAEKKHTQKREGHKKKKNKKENWTIQEPGYFFPYPGFIGNPFAFEPHTKIFLMIFYFCRLLSIMQWLSVKYIL